jgi:hypothetical protein
LPWPVLDAHPCPFSFSHAPAIRTISTTTITASHHPIPYPAISASGIATAATTAHRGSPAAGFGVFSVDTPDVAPAGGFVTAAGFGAADFGAADRRGRRIPVRCAVVTRTPHRSR